MEKQYYIPELDEFHVGMEVEVYEQSTHKMINDKKWHLVVVTVNNNDLGRSIGFNRIPGLIRNNHLRVKYLDRGDVESLGWKYEKTHPGMEEMFFTKNYGKNDFDYLGLDYDPESNYLRIYRYKTEGDNTYFAGTIRNISELRKLMKQLVIA